MPEVVYPSPDKDGNNRDWGQVFPYLPEECDDWMVINTIMQNIAYFNRFGCTNGHENCQSIEAHRVNYTNYIQQYQRERIANMKDEPQEAREKVMYVTGLWLFYLNEVYNNLGGAYREWKS